MTAFSGPPPAAARLNSKRSSPRLPDRSAARREKSERRRARDTARDRWIPRPSGTAETGSPARRCRGRCPRLEWSLPLPFVRAETPMALRAAFSSARSLFLVRFNSTCSRRWRSAHTERQIRGTLPNALRCRRRGRYGSSTMRRSSSVSARSTAAGLRRALRSASARARRSCAAFQPATPSASKSLLPLKLPLRARFS